MNSNFNIQKYSKLPTKRSKCEFNNQFKNSAFVSLKIKNFKIRFSIGLL